MSEPNSQPRVDHAITLPEGVVDKLASFPVFETVPRTELEWLGARGVVFDARPGQVMMQPGTPIDEMWIVLAGRLAVQIEKEGGWRKFLDLDTGFVLGAVPFSRMKTAPARLVADEDTTLFALNRSHLPELVHECSELTSALVHHMLDRTRDYRTAQLHDDRMQSLGRLAAGLAHELNNPASGAASHARSLELLLDDLQTSSRTLARARLSDEQLSAIDALQVMCEDTARARSALDVADREDEFSEWLVRHDVDPRPASVLAAASVSISALDHLADVLPKETLGTAIRYAASDTAARQAASQIMKATGRIHALVSAVKGFTFMDREGVPDDVDVARGLADTVAMLETKWRAKQLNVRVETAADLPTINAFGSELNQVWEKLIDNAIDAAPMQGNITVTATQRGDSVVVRVMDDGPGIAEDNRAHVFDPFFTTKSASLNTGLGLDIARRFVHLNDGDIEFTSQPGHTVFRVRLPVAVRRHS